jgi:hypothetical protein
MYLQKVITKKTKKKIIFCWRLEGHWRKQQNPDPDPDRDPLVRDMDPWIRIRTKIHGSAILVLDDLLAPESGLSRVLFSVLAGV